MPEAVIVDAIRTPIGRAFKGSLIENRPDEMTAFVIDQLLARNPDVDPATWEDVAGVGMRLYDLDINGTATPVVSCASCHEPHNRNNTVDPEFMWIDNAGSALCLTCHNK